MKKIWWFGYGREFAAEMEDFLDLLYARPLREKMKGRRYARQEHCGEESCKSSSQLQALRLLATRRLEALRICIAKANCSPNNECARAQSQASKSKN